MSILSKAQEEARRAAMRRLGPQGALKNDTPINYEQYISNYVPGARPTKVMSRDEFDALAQAPSTEQYRRDAPAHNERVWPTERRERFGQVAQRQQQATQRRQQSEELQPYIARYYDDLNKLGQTDQQSRIDWNNLARMSVAHLKGLEGDDDQAIIARGTAATILRDYREQLAPHLDLISPGLTNEDLGVEEAIKEMEDNRGRLEKVFRWIDETPGVNHAFDAFMGVLDPFATAGQLVPSTLAPVVAGHGREDSPSWAQRINQSTANLFRVAGATAIEAADIFTAGNLAETDERGAYGGINIADTAYIGDFALSEDETGMINLRESLGLDRDAGGISGDVLDFVGSVVVDPTTYLTFGTSSGATRTGRIVAKGMASVDDSSGVIARAGKRLLAGAKLDDLSDAEQLATRSFILQAQEQGLRNRKNWANWASYYRTHPLDAAKKVATQRAKYDDALDTLIKGRVSRVENAMQRGLAPAIRFRDRKLVDMTKLYDAIGLFDSRLASEARWAQIVRETTSLDRSDQLQAFMLAFDTGAEISDDVVDQIRNWDGFAKIISDDEAMEAWTRRVAASGATDEDVSRIADFIRTFADDTTARKFTEPFNQEARYRVSRAAREGDLGGFVEDVRGAGSEALAGRVEDVVGSARPGTLDEVLARTDFFSNLTDTRRPLEEAIKDLAPEAQATIRRNIDVARNPTKWVGENFAPRGLRSLRTRDDIIGKLVRGTSERFSTLSAVRGATGKGKRVADELSQAVAQWQGTSGLFSDHVRQLGVRIDGTSPLYEAAAKDLGVKTADEALEMVGSMMAGVDDITPAYNRLLEEGQNDAAELLQRLSNLREDILQLQVRAGADVTKYLDMKGYMPRVVTKEAREAFEKAMAQGDARLINAFGEIGITKDSIGPSGIADPLQQAGHIQRRSFARDVQDLPAVNDLARRHLRDAGLEGWDDFRLYETNPASAMLHRSKEAHEAYAYMDMISQMAKVTDDAGRPLIRIASTKDELADLSKAIDEDNILYGAANLKTIQLPNGGKIVGDSLILDEIDKVFDAATSARNFSGLRRTVNNAHGIWGAWATVPFVPSMSFGFHIRNMYGNIFNMTLAGFSSPGAFAEGFQVMKKANKVYNRMAETGRTFREAAEDLGLEASEIALLDTARQNGILNAGRVSDIFDMTEKLDTNQASRFTQGVNPASQHNVFLRMGSWLGRGIEDNARMALYLDQLGKGLSPQDAAFQVRKYLFDYKDLTKFEKDNMRTLARFYTWVRKNTALQAAAFMSQPGKVINTREAFLEAVNIGANAMGYGDGQDLQEGITPEGIRFPDWAVGNLRYYPGEDGKPGAFLGIALPADDAINTMDTLRGLVRSGVAMGGILASDDPRFEARQRENIGNAVRDALSLLSGPPAEGTKLLAEMATGTDLYTGGNLNSVDEGFKSQLFRLTDVLFPVLSATNRSYEGYTEDGRARLLNSVLGLRYNLNVDDDETRAANLAAAARDLKFSLYEIQEQGDYEVPSIEDLVDAGELMHRNELMSYMIRNVADPRSEPITAEQMEMIERYVPSKVLEAIGRDRLTKPKDEWSAEETYATLSEVRLALELMGVEWTQDMQDALMLRYSGVSMSDAEALGLEPSFRTNPYLGGDTPEESREVRLAEAQQRLEAVARMMGTDFEGLLERNPMLDYATRKMMQMAEAGYTQSEITAELMSELSREKRALLFGSDSLPMYRSYDLMTPEEELAFQKRWAKSESQLRVLLMLTAGREPTPDEMTEWFTETMLLAPEQEKLGYDNYRPPSAENITPDYIYDERLRQKLRVTNFGSGSLLAGLEVGG